MRKTKPKKGFTLVELMVALIVTGIIMSAVATLAFAFSTANDASDDTDRKQAQIRYASLRITELIRHCKLVCGVNGTDLVIWRDDDVPGGEGWINAEELVYIETDNNHIQIMEFSNCPTWLKTFSIRLDWLKYDWIKTTLMDNCDEDYVVMIPECSNVRFQFDASPPQSQFVNISFNLTENNKVRLYDIDSSLRCWAGHQVNTAGTDLIPDDD
ncbi:MAG: type II secretion system protein [Sedimentisphaerales bacterium]|nr:type II secretion system protein [Sedimentisphaerales bacterium]